ncbi:hypothetical protein ACMBCM_09175 [Spiroplasma sp. K1]
MSGTNVWWVCLNIRRLIYIYIYIYIVKILVNKIVGRVLGLFGVNVIVWWHCDSR